MSDFPRLVSVIIPAHNAASVIEGQLASLDAQTYRRPWELIVVDNCSSDNTREIAERWKDKLPLKVIDDRERLSPGHARNRGAAVAEGDLLAFCDADDSAEPEWLAELVRASEGCDLVGGSMMADRLNDEKVRSWHYRPLQSEKLPMHPGFLPYSGSGNVAVRTSVFHDLGGWDEVFAPGEDMEFSWRAQLAGYSLGYAKDAVMQIRYRSNLRSAAQQVYQYGKSHPKLYRRFRPHGLRRSSLREAATIWMRLAIRLPNLARGTTRRGNWIRIASLRFGRVVGSIQHRVIFL